MIKTKERPRFLDFILLPIMIFFEPSNEFVEQTA
jgi:hypothetical protein